MRTARFLFANKAFLRAVERVDRGLPQFPSDLVVREDKAAMADTVSDSASISWLIMPPNLSSKVAWISAAWSDVPPKLRKLVSTPTLAGDT